MYSSIKDFFHFIVDVYVSPNPLVKCCSRLASVSQTHVAENLRTFFMYVNSNADLFFTFPQGIHFSFPLDSVSEMDIAEAYAILDLIRCREGTHYTVFSCTEINDYVKLSLHSLVVLSFPFFSFFFFCAHLIV